MIKIWGRTFRNERIIKQSTIVVDPKTTTFFEMLKNLSSFLSIPTPVLLNKHVKDFNVFNMCTFKADDFVENIDFDKFILSKLQDE